MKYINNKKIKIGDTVILSDGSKGIVVCDFDENIYDDEYLSWETSNLKGIMISTDKYGLIHYEIEKNAQDDFDLLKHKE